jgi:Predicted nucleotide kinase (related to CMP and AMP kinases)
MPEKLALGETANTLKAIFEKHMDERICILGSVCVGKTTLTERLSDYNCVDMDAELWPNLPAEETELLNELIQKEWTEELGKEVDRLAYKYLKVKSGCPLFTTVVVDCDVLVYLDISDELLFKHCEKRGDDFTDAKNTREAVEKDWESHKARGDKTLYYVMTAE